MDTERQTDSASNSPLMVIESDRIALGRRARMPSWLAPGLGVVTSAWVASSSTARSDGTGRWYFLFLVAMVLVLVAIRSTGVRFKSIGVGGWLGYAGLVVVGLILYSASLALFSMGLDWWVAVPTVLMFGATVGGVRFIEESARRSLHHDR